MSRKEDSRVGKLDTASDRLLAGHCFALFPARYKLALGRPGRLGAILGQEGDSLRALYYLRRSFEADPQDPQTVYGLAFAYMEMGDMEPAQRHFQMVLEMEAPEELRRLARGGLRKIAARELKARGPRMDGSLLSAGRHAAVLRQVALGGDKHLIDGLSVVDHLNQDLKFQAGQLDFAPIYLEALFCQYALASYSPRRS